MDGLMSEPACGYISFPERFSCPGIKDMNGSVSDEFRWPKIEDDHPPLTEKKPGPETGAAEGGDAGKEGDGTGDSFEIVEVNDYDDYDEVIEKLSKEGMIGYEEDSDEDYRLGGSEVDWDMWNEYYEQIKKSEGFDVDFYPGCSPAAPFRPNPFFKEYPEKLKFIEALANLALESFNAEHRKRFEFVEMEKVVEGICSCIMYYLTFKAKDPDEADTDAAAKIFQAKVYDGIKEQRVELCRIKV